MIVVNQAVTAMISGGYARKPEHIGKIEKNTLEYRVINKSVQVARPVEVDNSRTITIENQFEVYI